MLVTKSFFLRVTHSLPPESSPGTPWAERFLNNGVLAAQIDIYKQMLIIRKAIVETQIVQKMSVQIQSVLLFVILSAVFIETLGL